MSPSTANDEERGSTHVEGRIYKANQEISFAIEKHSVVHIFIKFEKDEYLIIKITCNANFVKNELLANGIKVIKAH